MKVRYRLHLEQLAKHNIRGKAEFYTTLELPNNADPCAEENKRTALRNVLGRCGKEWDVSLWKYFSFYSSNINNHVFVDNVWEREPSLFD